VHFKLYNSIGYFLRKFTNDSGWILIGGGHEHFKKSEDLREFVTDVKKEFGKYIQNFESVTLFSTKKYTYLPEELR